MRVHEAPGITYDYKSLVEKVGHGIALWPLDVPIPNVPWKDTQRLRGIPGHALVAQTPLLFSPEIAQPVIRDIPACPTYHRMGWRITRSPQYQLLSVDFALGRDVEPSDCIIGIGQHG